VASGFPYLAYLSTGSVMSENRHIEVQHHENYNAHVLQLGETDLEDRLSAINLETELADWFAANQPARTVVSFERVATCSTDVINAVLRARKIAIDAGGYLVLCALSEEVSKVFNTLSLDTIFEIAPDVDAGLALLPAK